MKTLLSVVAASAFALSATTAFAGCGHQSVKLEQTVASTSVLPAEQEAVTTNESVEEKKLPAEEAKSE